MTKIIIEQIPTGKWKENCYIVHNQDNDAVIIDPGANAKKIIQYVSIHRLNILAILNTHAHYDHVGAVAELKEEYSSPFILHSKDRKLLKTANMYATIFENSKPIMIPEIEHYFDMIKIEDYIKGFTISVIHTPGHTCGSVCIRISDCLFTGDTIFNGDIGRTDLPGGDQVSLNESLKLISNLTWQLRLFPGHGVETTLENELKHNKRFIRVIQ